MLVAWLLEGECQDLHVRASSLATCVDLGYLLTTLSLNFLICKMCLKNCLTS